MEEKASMPTVNDGKGLLDNVGLIDSMVNDCNTAIKNLVDGNYILWCDRMMVIVRKLTNLKTGIQNEKAIMEEYAKQLKQTNDELAEQLYGVPVDKEEVTENGN